MKDTPRALAFYADALGARELFRMPPPDGGAAHAEFIIGNTHSYISDGAPDWHAVAMPEGATASCLFSINIEDCDSAYKQATAAGAVSLSEPEDQFWGARSAMSKDPFGYRWSLIQKIEEVSPEELLKRARALFTAE